MGKSRIGREAPFRAIPRTAATHPPSPSLALRYPPWGRRKYCGKCWSEGSFPVRGVRWSWRRCRSFAGLPGARADSAGGDHGKVKRQVGKARGCCGNHRNRPPRHGRGRGDEEQPAAERRGGDRRDGRDGARRRFRRHRRFRCSGPGGCRFRGPGRSCRSARTGRNDRSQGRQGCGRRDGLFRSQRRDRRDGRGWSDGCRGRERCYRRFGRFGFLRSHRGERSNRG